MFVKIIIGLFIFAYFAIAVVLFNKLDRALNEAGVDLERNDIKYSLTVIFVCLFWPMLLFVKPGNNS